VVSPEAWLSTWSGVSSRAEIARTGRGMTLPCLLIHYSGDHCIFPSDAEGIASALATTRFERVDLHADHYGFPSRAGREPAVAAIADWLRRCLGDVPAR
jgi:hypothetical protein